MIKIQYNTARYNFHASLSKHLGVDLYAIQTDAHRDDAIRWIRDHIVLYESFMREVILPVFADDIVYQTLPEVVISNIGGIGYNHRTRDVSSMKFILPLTEIYLSNSIHVNTGQELKPVDVNYGQLVMTHSGVDMIGVINTSGKSSVCLVFDVMPANKFPGSNRIGSEWSIMTTRI